MSDDFDDDDFDDEDESDDFGKDAHTEFLDVFTEAFGGYKKKIGEYFDGPNSAGRTDVRRKC